VTDPNSYKARLEAKLQPARVRATRAFAGLFQLTHEMLKSMVLNDVQSFYGYISVGDGTWLPESGEHEYRPKVLDLVPGKPSRASLPWLQNMDAITPRQAGRPARRYLRSRHDLIHELARYLIDPDRQPDFDLLIEALKTLRGISRFWTEVEAGYGTFDDFPDPDLDEVINGRVAHSSTSAYARTAWA
jgi:hypothetical protein